MSKLLSVFVSATPDMALHRQEVQNACTRFGFEVLSEEEPLEGENATSQTLSLTERADVYVGIFGNKYGPVLTVAQPERQVAIRQSDTKNDWLDADASISRSEVEYQYAANRGIPCLIFLIHEDHPVRVADVETGERAETLKLFKQRLASERGVVYFRSPEELRSQVILALSQYWPQPTASQFRSDLPLPPEPYIPHPYAKMQAKTLVGRKESLNVLSNWIDNSKSEAQGAHTFCLTGISGIGKSALMWNWFNEIAPSRMKPLSGRLWWHFAENGDFGRFLLYTLAYVTGQPAGTFDNLTYFDMQERLLTILDREPFLLVLDGLDSLLVMGQVNAENADEFEHVQSYANTRHIFRAPVEEGINYFLRRLAGLRASRVLIGCRVFPTSLETVTGDPISGSFRFNLPDLSDADAISLWNELGMGGNRQSVLSLFHTVANHPDFIQAIAGEVAQFRRAPKDFDVWRSAHSTFNPYSLPLTEVKREIAGRYLSLLDAQTLNVARTIALMLRPTSYETLTSLIVRRNNVVNDRKVLDDVLTELEALGLLQHDTHSGEFNMHAVVRGIIQQTIPFTTRKSIYEKFRKHFQPLTTTASAERPAIEHLNGIIELYHAYIGLNDFDTAYETFESSIDKHLDEHLGFHYYIYLLEMLFVNGMERLPGVTDRGQQASILSNIGYYYTYCSYATRAIPILRSAITFAERTEKESSYILSLLYLSVALSITGSLREAEGVTRHALQTCREQYHVYFEGRVLLRLAKLALICGNHQTAVSAMGRALRIDTDINIVSAESNDYIYIAQLDFGKGDFNNAYTHATRGWELAVVSNYAPLLVTASRLQGAALLELGKLEEAEERLYYALTQAEKIGIVTEQLESLTALAQLRFKQKRYYDAQTLLNEALEPAKSSSYAQIYADVLNLMTEVLQHIDGNLAPAVATEQAQKAFIISWGDGPPFAYASGLETARKRLAGLGLPEPKLSPYDDYKYEPLIDIKIDPDDEYGVRRQNPVISPRTGTTIAVEMPVYLLSVQVQNVRCFGAAQTLDLSDGKGRPAQWTVILGNNGVGKTTLLKSLASIDASIDPLFLREQHLFTRQMEKPATSELAALETNRSESRVSAKVYYGASLTTQALGQMKDAVFVRSSNRAVQSDVEKPEQIEGLLCYGYGAARRMGESSLSGETSASHSASLFSDEVALQNAEEWLLQTDYAANKPSNVQERAAKRLLQIKNLLTDLLPDVQEIHIVAPSETNQQSHVEFKTSYGWVPIHNLSLGYRTLVAWMVDLARRMFDRYPDSLRPLEEPAIVLVDEIDLHLHPRWQRDLMQFLSKWFTNTQFIVTAHSALVVQSAANANIVLLRPCGDHVEICNNVTDIRGYRVDQVLTSDLFDLPSARPPTLDEPMAERTEILSKGTLTEADEARLKELEAQIGPLPTAETQSDIEAMDIIRKTAELLKQLEAGD